MKKLQYTKTNALLEKSIPDYRSVKKIKRKGRPKETADREFDMRREVLTEDLKKLYTVNDMVKTDCGGCTGCSQCCSGMGESIVLDPYDSYCLSAGLGIAFPDLVGRFVEWNLVDAVVLPNLMMQGKEEKCAFLAENGRSCIHDFRPGICRMFPLGRYYEEDGSFRYFLQSREWPKENKTKIKISKWLGIPNLKRYEDYIMKWHGLLEEVRELTQQAKDEQLTKELTVYLLNTCYLTPYHENTDFYDQFEERYHRMKKLLQVLSQKSE